MKSRVLLSLAAITVLPTIASAKTLFCTASSATRVRVQPAEPSRRMINLPSLDWFLAEIALHPERQQPTAIQSNVTNYGNEGVGFWDVTHGKCTDSKKRAFNIHIVGGGLSLRTNSSAFIVECPLISTRRFEPIGYIARFAGTKVSATGGVGAEIGAFTNVRGGFCVLAGVNAGIGAGVEIGGMSINRVSSPKFRHKKVDALINLTDAELLKTFETGVGLMKIIVNPLKPGQNEADQTYRMTFRAEYKHDENDVIKASVLKGVADCAVPKVKDLFDYKLYSYSKNPYAVHSVEYMEPSHHNRGLLKDAAQTLRQMLDKGCVL